MGFILCLDYFVENVNTAKLFDYPISTLAIGGGLNKVESKDTINVLKYSLNSSGVT